MRSALQLGWQSLIQFDSICLLALADDNDDNSDDYHEDEDRDGEDDDDDDDDDNDDNERGACSRSCCCCYYCGGGWVGGGWWVVGGGGWWVVGGGWWWKPRSRALAIFPNKTPKRKHPTCRPGVPPFFIQSMLRSCRYAVEFQRRGGDTIAFNRAYSQARVIA